MNQAYLILQTEWLKRPTDKQPDRVVTGNPHPRIIALSRDEAARWIKETIEDHMSSIVIQEGREPRVVLDLDRPEPTGAVINYGGTGFRFEARETNVTGGNYDHTVRRRRGMGA